MQDIFEKHLSTTITLQSAIYQTLKEVILNEEIDGHFTENEIAKKLNVSRTPVREAMQKLASEGLIEISHGRKAKINFITNKDIKDIAVLLTSLHCISTELCILNATDDNICQLEEIIALMRLYTERQDADKLTMYNAKFHLKICEFSGNKWIHNILVGLLDYTLVFRKKAVSKQGRAETALLEHTQILQAIKERDIEKAKKLITEHVQRAHSATPEGKY